MERSTVFQIADLSAEVSVKSARFQIACPDSRSRLVLRLSGLQRNSLRDSYLRRAGQRKNYLSLIPSQLHVSRRELKLFLGFGVQILHVTGFPPSLNIQT
jgi:hypothetical protein